MHVVLRLEKLTFFLQDGYVRAINALPANLPKIEWALYKAKIPVAGKGHNDCT